MDVGAGNGILSLFSLQAGARLVYAVEASNMVQNLQHLVQAASHSDTPVNEWIHNRFAVVHSRMEDVNEDVLKKCAPVKPTGDASKVDTIVSECLGVLLVHERMCESFIDARDRFLRPGGTVFPHSGTLCFSLLNDSRLYQDVKARGEWWNTANFYGVDLTPFVDAARSEAFSSPVVGCFSPIHVVGTTPEGLGMDSAVCRYVIDFSTITNEELKEFDVPLAFDCIDEPVIVHGLGGWFDLSFLQDEDDADAITVQQNTMTTSPFAPATHWAQVRMLFPEPLALNAGQRVLGTLHFKANESRSYNITANLEVPQADDVKASAPLFRRTARWKLDKQTYSWETM